MKTALVCAGFVLLGAFAAIVLTACPLDPAKVPPCSPYAKYPDPCAAAPRDAGVDG